MRRLLQKYATPVCIAVFLALALSGCLMFVGLKNHDLVELHEKIGICFVLFAVLHLARNWKSFGIMLREKASPWIIGCLGALGIGLVIAMLVVPGEGHGSSVRGQIAVAQQLAHQPLEKMAVALDLSSAEVRARLQAGGVLVSGEESTLADIANKSSRPVGQLFLLLTNNPYTSHNPGSGRHRHHH